MSQILHSRFIRNLLDSPKCVYCSYESTSHYLLYCDRNRELRVETLFSLYLPNVKVLHSGSDNRLNDDQNKLILI